MTTIDAVEGPRRGQDEDGASVSQSPSDAQSALLRPRRKHRPSNGHLPSPLRRTKSYNSPEGNPDQDSLASAITTTMFTPTWLPLAGVLTLIFGGCCTNVFALESIVKAAPDSGTVITAFQVLTTALFTLPNHLDYSRGIRNLYLKERTIPLSQWAIFALMFVTINVLNNKAFGYRISVPLHIILRSAGPVSTMAVGYIFGGRRYRPLQIIAVCLLFLGVVMAALSDARSKSKPIQSLKTPSTSSKSHEVSSPSSSEFWIGFAILFLALLLSAFLGLFTDRFYARHGRGKAEENLFYSHALALPYFLFRLDRLSTQFMRLARAEGTIASFILTPQQHQPSLHRVLLSKIPFPPLQLTFLVINGLTQYVCIRGVNALSARTSSLTVGIVLNIRKLVSLLASIWLFGNRLDDGVLLGAAVVFIGGALYAWPTSSTNNDNKKTTTTSTTAAATKEKMEDKRKITKEESKQSEKKDS